MSKTRRNHGSAFKAKVALEALKGERTVAEIASKHGLHPTLVTEWKRQLADGASSRKGTAKSRRIAPRWSASFTSKSASRKWNWIFWHASSVTKETPQNKRVEYGQLQINGFWEAAATVVSVA